MAVALWLAVDGHVEIDDGALALEDERLDPEGLLLIESARCAQRQQACKHHAEPVAIVQGELCPVGGLLVPGDAFVGVRDGDMERLLPADAVAVANRAAPASVVIPHLFLENFAAELRVQGGEGCRRKWREGSSAALLIDRCALRAPHAGPGCGVQACWLPHTACGATPGTLPSSCAVRSQGTLRAAGAGCWPLGRAFLFLPTSTTVGRLHAQGLLAPRLRVNRVNLLKGTLEYLTT